MFLRFFLAILVTFFCASKASCCCREEPPPESIGREHGVLYYPETCRLTGHFWGDVRAVQSLLRKQVYEQYHSQPIEGDVFLARIERMDGVLKKLFYLISQCPKIVEVRVVPENVLGIHQRARLSPNFQGLVERINTRPFLNRYPSVIEDDIFQQDVAYWMHYLVERSTTHVLK